MHVARIDPQHPDRHLVSQAVNVLRRGGLVVFPTETAYALGCDPANAAAVERIFAAKERDRSKPLPFIAASRTMVERYACMDRVSRKLASRFWPGPLTLILDSKSAKGRRAFVTAVTNAHREAAVRVSPHPVARALSRRLGRPIVSTSANRSGGETPYRALDAVGQLGVVPDMLLDAGTLQKRKTSTIVRCTEEGCNVLREGAIPAGKLQIPSARSQT